MNTVTLGGTATINDLVSVARFGAKVAFSKEYEERVNHCRAHVDRFSHEGKAIYGLTTGLGDNWKKFIPEKDRETIQRNNIYAHTCAVGEPIAEECTRAMMFVMLCHFGSGHTGIRFETLALIRDMLNAGISPIVPGHGSVGYLTLEGHIGMVMIGEGRATYQGETLDGAEVLKRAGLKPVVLSSKEGLILLSGTTSVTAFASLAIYDAQTLSLTADIAGSFTLEVLKGTLMAMDERLMAVRPHPDQINTAANIRAILKDSPMLERYRGHRVQDALSIRCMPQLHGPVKKAVKDAQTTLAIELNSSVDNPLIFDELKNEATGVYVAPRTRIITHKDRIVRPEQLRVARRMIRDYQGRGHSLRQTVERAESVDRGELNYIMPNKPNASIHIDTFHDYEPCILARYLKEIPEFYSQLDDQFIAEHGLSDLMDVVNSVPSLRTDYVPRDSIVREFVGGSCFEY